MSTLTIVLLLVIWTLVAIIYGLISVLGSPRSREWNLMEKVLLLPFFAVALVLRIKL